MNRDRNFDLQIDSNTARRVAAGSVIIAAAIGFVSSERTRNQLLGAIRRLPRFYEAFRTSPSNAWIDIARIPDPRQAERIFQQLSHDQKGSGRFDVNRSMVEYMTKPDRYIETAEAVTASLRGAHVVQTKELGPKKGQVEYAVRLTSRDFTTALKRAQQEE